MCGRAATRILLNFFSSKRNFFQLSRVSYPGQHTTGWPPSVRLAGFSPKGEIGRRDDLARLLSNNFSVEMAMRFALALDIGTDELLHPKAKKISSKKPSRRVLRRVQEIERLPP